MKQRRVAFTNQIQKSQRDGLTFGRTLSRMSVNVKGYGLPFHTQNRIFQFGNLWRASHFQSLLGARKAAFAIGHHAPDRNTPIKMSSGENVNNSLMATGRTFTQ